MLKRRLKKWGLNRYHNEVDAAGALQLAIEREEQSKKTAFIIGNKKVTREEIDRYLLRKGIKDPRSFALNPDRKPPISTIVPYTPPPSPPPLNGSDELNDRPGTRSADEESIANAAVPVQGEDYVFPTEESLRLSGTIQARAALAGPREIELLQRALLGNDAYCRSTYAFRTPPEITKATLANVDELLDTFTSGMWLGRDRLIACDMTSAFKYFAKAFDSIDIVTFQCSRRFLPELFEMVQNFQLGEPLDILQSLLCFIEQICRINIGQNGWLSEIVGPLLQLSYADRIEAAERLMQNIAHHFQANFDPDRLDTKPVMKALSRSAFGRKPISEAILHLLKILRDNQTAASIILENCKVLPELVVCHRGQSRLEEAAVRAEALRWMIHETDIKDGCLRIVTCMQQRRDDWQGSFDLVWKCLPISLFDEVVGT